MAHFSIPSNTQAFVLVPPARSRPIDFVRKSRIEIFNRLNSINPKLINFVTWAKMSFRILDLEQQYCLQTSF
jgi:hypothetical protein